MRVTRIFTGEDGRSHFEELTLPLTEAVPPATLAATLPITGATVSEAHGGTLVERHTAPRRQLLINLMGTCELECTDGVRSFGPGDIRFGDDTTGEGHVTRVVDDVRVLILTLPDDLDISPWRA